MHKKNKKNMMIHFRMTSVNDETVRRVVLNKKRTAIISFEVNHLSAHETNDSSCIRGGLRISSTDTQVNSAIIFQIINSKRFKPGL
jgi:tRNA 2-selenouridine synthase SelU